jgi:galactokinase/galacturonokinase
VEPLAARAQRERSDFARRFGADARDALVAVAPYRVCPLGAHIDHQLGPVVSLGIAAWTVLAFAPSGDGRVRMASRDFEGEVAFDLAGLPAPGEGWGRYLRAAAWAVSHRLPPRPVGIVGWVSGSLPGAGLSSSASVLVAYLLALARANDLTLAPEELVAAARRAENEFVGVASGALDPVSVVAARRGRLLEIDTREPRWRPLAPGPGAPAWRILVVHTGSERHLPRTPFNQRVEECRGAAALLGERSGLPEVRVLGDLPDAAIEAFAPELPPALRGRALHFLGERRRVLRGAEAWRRGDLAVFGGLMFESCRSSIENYETGSAEQIALQAILEHTPGVLGARFSGAGWGGCSVALVDAAVAEDARRQVEREFVRVHPQLEGHARAFLVETEDGARLS